MIKVKHGSHYEYYCQFDIAMQKDTFVNQSDTDMLVLTQKTCHPERMRRISAERPSA